MPQLGAFGAARVQRPSMTSVGDGLSGGSEVSDAPPPQLASAIASTPMRADARRNLGPHFMVGMLNSAPPFVPLGQREVTVLVLV